MTLDNIHEYNELVDFIESDYDLESQLVDHQLKYEQTLSEGFSQLEKIKNKAMMNELKYPRLDEGFFEGIEDTNTLLDKVNSLANMLLDSILEEYDDSEFEELLSKYETILADAEEKDKVSRAINVLTVYNELIKQ